MRDSRVAEHLWHRRIWMDQSQAWEEDTEDGEGAITAEGVKDGNDGEEGAAPVEDNETADDRQQDKKSKKKKRRRRKKKKKDKKKTGAEKNERDAAAKDEEQEEDGDAKQPEEEEQGENADAAEACLVGVERKTDGTPAIACRSPIACIAAEQSTDDTPVIA